MVCIVSIFDFVSIHTEYKVMYYSSELFWTLERSSFNSFLIKRANLKAETTT